MRIAVTGKSGQVVSALIERADDVELVLLGRPELDLLRLDEFARALRDARPDVVVSAAAYTAVDKAESEPEIARQINAIAPGVVAAAAADMGVPVIHLSTDYVFDGSNTQPYVETDGTNPLGVYGSTKLAGEIAVAEANPDHAILRTAWVYSPFGANFLKTMLRLAGERPELRVVADQLGNPTSALDIADAVLRVARNMMEAPGNSALRGVFHMVGAGDTSWSDFAREIMSSSARHGGPSANVHSIGTKDYPTPARRPANSRLNTSKLADAHDVVLPDWRESTGDVVRRLVMGA